MIAAVENGILARLKAAADAGALGYAWKLLESYPANWDEYFKTKGQLATPAAWVTFAGFQGFTRDNSSWRAQAIFGLVVAARNLRNETATRQGHRNAQGALVEPGSYQLLIDALGLLGNQTLGLDIDKLQPERVQLVDDAKGEFFRGASLFGIQFRTTLPIASLPFDGPAELADFSTFHANWDVRPFGNVDADPDTTGAQIPADSTADATDHLEIVP